MKRLFIFIMALFMITAFSGGTALATTTDDDCTTETTGWVLESPGEGWVQVDQRTVVDQEAADGYWADLVWHNYTGNDKEYPEDGPGPDLDDPNWHALPADPQSEVHSVPPRVPNVPYNVSTNDNGNGSWFLWTGTWVPAVEEVTHEEYVFEKTTCDEPKPVTETLTQDKMNCDGVFERTVTVTTLEGEVISREVGEWTLVRDLTKAEKAELECNVPTDKPEPKPDPKGDKDPEPNTPAPPQDTLPHTGGEAWLAMLAAALLAAGGSLILGSRKLTGN